MQTLLEKFGIRTKILTLLVITSLVGLVIAIIGLNGIHRTDAVYSQMVHHEDPATAKLIRFNRHVTQMMYASYRTLVYDGGSRMARDAAAEEQKTFEGAMATMKDARKLDPALQQKILGLEQKLNGLQAILSDAVAHSMRNDKDYAKTRLAAADSIAVGLTSGLGKFNDMRFETAAQHANEVSAEVSQLASTLILIAIIGLVSGIGSGLYVSHAGIIRPLNRLKDVMSDLANNRVHVDVPGTGRADEMGAMAQTVQVFKSNAIAKMETDAMRETAAAAQKLMIDTLDEKLDRLAHGKLDSRITIDVDPGYQSVKTNFNNAIESLSELVGSVLESANSIQTGAEEISRASEDLARRTESNAASLEETSAAIAEMDTRLKATATAAEESLQGASVAMTAVTGGRSRAHAAVQAMSKVAESAKGIDNVIEGLDKIAFQTRVLAMNAAVEAGRAGDAGRGFAVVADLVSALAMRAEEEAKLARGQLTITQEEITTAVEAVEKVDNSLSDIASSGEKSNQLTGQMASDNVAQSSAVTQISAAIASMNTATQQNAAMVEETSAAARSLNEEIGSLVEKAGRFDLGRGQTGPGRQHSSMSSQPAASWARKQAGASYATAARAMPALPTAAVAALTRPDSPGDDWMEF